MYETKHIAYSETLESNFESGTLARGKNYYNSGNVISVVISDDQEQIDAKVLGSSSRVYTVEIIVDWDQHLVEGFCTCPVGYNCKHVVASLLAADDQNQTRTPNQAGDIQPTADFNQWFSQFNDIFNEQKKSSSSSSKKNKKTEDHLIYSIKQYPYTNEKIELTLHLSRVLKKGGYGKPKPFKHSKESHRKCLNSKDIEILSALQFINNLSSGAMNNFNIIFIEGPTASQWLKTILETDRCFWNEDLLHPMRLEEELKPEFKWELLPNAHQKFKACLNGKSVELFSLDQLWYLDSQTFSMGLVSINAPASMVYKLFHAPEVPPEASKELASYIKKMSPELSLIPQALPKPKLLKVAEFTPEIRFDVKTLSLPVSMAEELVDLDESITRWASQELEIPITIPTAEILFDYGVSTVPFSRQFPHERITFVEDGKVYAFDRDFKKEKEYILQLSNHMELQESVVEKNDLPAQPEIAFITSLQDEGDFIEFSVHTLPELELNGWRVIRQHDSFVQVYLDEDLSWYSELEEESEYDYFSFNIGIIIEGQKINILPLISNMMNTININELSNLKDDERVPISLADGTVLSAPYSRIKPILNILIELYDNELSTSDTIKLSKRQAALLFEIEKAFQASKLRWFGGEKLLRLGKQLNEFKSLKVVNPPKTFKTTLRSYQKDGVNWLQFLREYELGGILADDMGLGKTIQTLAHLSIEKNRRRMKKPSLIIAPTSLIYNWKREAAQFTPNLKVLIHHGEQRHTNIGHFSHYDLILTTYPLIIRDKEALLSNAFYYLILDEAQYIKNHRAKSTQIVHQIDAEHRLCLTGTPMENHLGELWSIFHFIMPGFLGETQQFKQVFRTPIEKHNDRSKQQSLASRIRPFMLRRQKDEVLNDLPEKTEILHTVELQGPQRDLYESIRLSMEKKVRDAINKKGLSRSHIIILDALLKLRQVCCDPRLLSLSSAKEAHGYSAKMAMLMEMLPSMIEEGRRILLFSQFTKMLGIIENALKDADLTYTKLTGSTRDRSKPVETFQSGKVPIFLISLKAGGTGLNLTEADTVIHYDPWWNPAVENQATDRAHRYGQKKSVFVYKLQASGTVEETIQEMQKKKSGLMEGLFSEKRSGKLELSSDDLRSLFKQQFGQF